MVPHLKAERQRPKAARNKGELPDFKPKIAETALCRFRDFVFIYLLFPYSIFLVFRSSYSACQ